MTFSGNNELAFHVADPSAAEEFYTGTLGCTVVDRTPDCISLTSGALRLYLLRDPVLTHDAVIPSFDVPNRAAASLGFNQPDVRWCRSGRTRPASSMYENRMASSSTSSNVRPSIRLRPDEHAKRPRA